jgi:hypothetical protein
MINTHKKKSADHMIAEKPILFTAPMVRAILDGRKTQTRLVLKPQQAWLWPNAKVGDLLWVREAFRTETPEQDHIAPRSLSPNLPMLFEADANWSQNKTVGKLRPSMVMPRWASRITLRVTDIRVQWLQDTSEEDATAEGCGDASHEDIAALFAENPSAYAVSMATTGIDPVTVFCVLWESINGPGSWDANPLVAAISFERVK